MARLSNNTNPTNTPSIGQSRVMAGRILCPSVRVSMTPNMRKMPVV